MKKKSCGLYTNALWTLIYLPLPAMAIEVHPTTEQIQAALDKGKQAAQQHSPPDALYVRFGAADDLHPSGFLVTKLSALSVMATHMALRGAEPTEADIAQALDAKTMMVGTVIFGNDPAFAVDSYMVLDQGGHSIKPVTVRFDGQAGRSAVWPASPRFKAKVVGAFNYEDFNPMAAATLTVFPASGGESSFHLDFRQIQ